MTREAVVHYCPTNGRNGDEPVRGGLLASPVRATSAVWQLPGGGIMKPTEETKQFWLMLYALDALGNALWACDYLLKHEPHVAGPTHRALMTAILTNYGRPFHKNHGVGKLDASIVPAEFHDLHQQLVRERDKVHAHSDAQGIPTRIGNANQIRLLRLPDAFKWVTSTYLPYEEPDIRRIRRLCLVLTDELDRRTDEYEKRCLPEIRNLSPGEYLLNTDTAAPELFTKVGSVLPPNGDLDATPI